MSSEIINPILKGFNPDPSICRVGNEYYIATSTFEWFPGVQIHHSNDLNNWTLIAHPLNRTSQLDMRGIDDSCGVWAPCLTHCDDKFYLIYTNVRNLGMIKDTPNYLVMCDKVTGDWSDPVYLNCSGFDPSLFHDDDGRKWLVNMKWSSDFGKHNFDGILLQEYSEEEQKLVGPIYNIFKGSLLRLTEGPHIYKHNGYYYLMTAEGGTGYEHAVTLARSKSLTGPYEIHPQNPILTSVGSDTHAVLQKAGHGCLVNTPENEWYLAHLCARPVRHTKRCILGRETAIQSVEWREDGWLYLTESRDTDANFPHTNISAPRTTGENTAACNQTEMLEHFDSEIMNIHLNTLRRPPTSDMLSLTARKSYLRLFGQQSPESKFDQSLIARRQQGFCFSAETYIEFTPTSCQHMAGLIYYYNTANFYYLAMSYDDDRQENYLKVIAANNKDYCHSTPYENNIYIGSCTNLYMKLIVDLDIARFMYSFNGSDWLTVPIDLDATALSDDAVTGTGFTGAFIGLCCQDLAYGGHHADFDYLHYIEH